MSVPVTLVSGYLGAGKTSIINAALRHNDSLRLCILVNDFGALEVDAKSIQAQDGETISLVNGCVCCSIGNDLAEALGRIKDRTPLDHVIIEASGVADPQRIAMMSGFWPGMKLNSIVTAIDVARFQRLVQDKYVGSLVRRQVKRADLRVLTHTSELSKGAIADVSKRIILDFGGNPTIIFDDKRLDIRDLLRPAPSPGAAEVGALVASEPFSKVTWRPKRPLKASTVAACLVDLPDEVQRVKGFIFDDEDQQWVLVERVGREVYVSRSPERSDFSEGLDVILIGGNTKVCSVLDKLENCCGSAG